MKFLTKEYIQKLWQGSGCKSYCRWIFSFFFRLDFSAAKNSLRIVIDLETGQTKENISVFFYQNPRLRQVP
jgi:hypothetical protein